MEIGSDSFGFVETFNMDGLNSLKTLKIGPKSFTHYKNYDYFYPGSSFHIKNCALLESIEIGGNSFSDYSGEFELANLPSLQSIIIKDMMNDDWMSYSFYDSAFVIRGIIDR